MMSAIGSDRNAGMSRGNQFIFASDGDVLLDGKHFKNVVFRNVKVVYNGGPSILENVYFLNCTFDVSPGPAGQEFAGKLLEGGPSVTAKIG